MTLNEIKQTILGEWVSLAPEVRPSSSKNTDGSMKPFYLTRHFTYLAGDKFDLQVVNFADAYGKIALVKIGLKGTMEWKGEHPIAAGAQKVNFAADEGYEVTPLVQGFADAMNAVASKGFAKWEINVTQSIFKKAFPPFGLTGGQIFSEFDLIYLNNGLMFWGARNVDGRGFDKEENRPTNLQIPLIKIEN